MFLARVLMHNSTRDGVLRFSRRRGLLIDEAGLPLPMALLSATMSCFDVEENNVMIYQTQANCRGRNGSGIRGTVETDVRTGQPDAIRTRNLEPGKVLKNWLANAVLIGENTLG